VFGERTTMTTAPPKYGVTPPDRRRRTVFWAVVSILILLTIMLLAVVFRSRGGAPTSPDREEDPPRDSDGVTEDVVAWSSPATVGSPHGKGDRGLPGARAGGQVPRDGEAHETVRATLT